MEIALTATERENGPYCPFLLPQWLLRSSAEFKLFIPFFFVVFVILRSKVYIHSAIYTTKSALSLDPNYAQRA